MSRRWLYVGVVWFSVFGLSVGNSAVFAAELEVQLVQTYSEVKSILYQSVSQNPGNAEIFQLGVADSGDVIEGIKIGHGAVHQLVVSTHHGNEFGSTEVALALAASLSAHPILGQTVFVVPVLNVPGFNARSRWEAVRGRSYDSNRDYPGPCGTEGPFHLKSTQALADLIERENIVASSTLHTFSPSVTYPWGFSTHDVVTRYEQIFIDLAQAATVESRYEIGNSTEVMYPANGTFEDYAFWKHGIWSLLFELGSSHYPSQVAVNEMIRVNVSGIRRMMEQAPPQRAERHEFEGNCDRRLSLFDAHEE